MRGDYVNQKKKKNDNGWPIGCLTFIIFSVVIFGGMIGLLIASFLNTGILRDLSNENLPIALHTALCRDDFFRRTGRHPIYGGVIVREDGTHIHARLEHVGRNRGRFEVGGVEWFCTNYSVFGMTVGMPVDNAATLYDRDFSLTVTEYGYRYLHSSYIVSITFRIDEHRVVTSIFMQLEISTNLVGHRAN